VTRQVRILRRAERDLEEILHYLQRERPRSARSVVEGLLSGSESLSTHPERGARPRDGRLSRLGYRFLTRGPYLIFYKVLSRQVRVYRVLHGKRRYQALLRTGLR
jgi:addiction module RelE/StbE family toxin